MQSKAMMQALASIKQAMQQVRCRTGATLPTARIMATDAGVSQPTILRALAHLHSKGILTVRQGAATRIGSDTKKVEAFVFSDTTAFPAKRVRPVAAAQRISRDLSNGFFSDTEFLPTFKELSVRYGVCYRTLKTVLDDFVREMHLERHGKHYRVPHTKATGPRKTVVLFCRGEETGELIFYSPHEHDEFRSLIANCSRMELRLVVVACYFIAGSDELRYKGDEFNAYGTLEAQNDRILGFIIWRMGLKDDFYNKLKHMLPRHGHPMSVLDFEGADDGLIVHPGGCIVRHFRIAESVDSGKAVATYLMGLKHRSVAYFSLADDSTWSKKRQAGIETIVARYGVRGAVCTYEANFRIQYLEKIGAVNDIAVNIRQATRTALSTIGGDPRRSTEISDKMIALFHERFASEGIRVITDPFFIDALSHPEITAWVGANDAIAIAALDFLKRHKVPVPQRISVIGFDDSLEASYNRLTSYNFGGAAIMKAMILHLLHPLRSLSGASLKQPVEVTGFITVRDSTGDANKNKSNNNPLLSV